MKRFLIIGILLVFVASANAQGQFSKPLKSQRQSTNLAASSNTIGVKLGCPWSLMIDSEFSHVSYAGNVGYNFGLVFEHYFSKFSIGIEGLFSQKGTKMYYDMSYQQNLTTNGIFHREYYLGFNMVSVRIPVTFYFNGAIKDDKFVPYAFIAPQFDMPLGFNATFRKGNFLMETPPTQTTITTYGSYYDEQTKPFDVSSLYNIGALAGVGLMTRIHTESSAIIIKFDVAANFGLRNLAEEGFIVKKNSSGDLVLKDNVNPVRLHDAEANVTVIFPIRRRLRDACYFFDKK